MASLLTTVSGVTSHFLEINQVCRRNVVNDTKCNKSCDFVVPNKNYLYIGTFYLVFSQHLLLQHVALRYIYVQLYDVAAIICAGKIDLNKILEKLKLPPVLFKRSQLFNFHIYKHQAPFSLDDKHLFFSYHAEQWPLCKMSFPCKPGLLWNTQLYMINSPFS